MKRDPWTDPDPQPGDFDEFLENMDPSCVTFYPGNPEATLRIIRDDEVPALRRRPVRPEASARRPE